MERVLLFQVGEVETKIGRSEEKHEVVQVSCESGYIKSGDGWVSRASPRVPPRA